MAAKPAPLFSVTINIPESEKFQIRERLFLLLVRQAETAFCFFVSFRLLPLLLFKKIFDIELTTQKNTKFAPL